MISTTVNRMISMLKRRIPRTKSVDGSFLGQAGRELAERRPAAGPTDQDGRGSADDGGAREYDIGGAGRVFFRRKRGR